VTVNTRNSLYLVNNFTVYKCDLVSLCVVVTFLSAVYKVRGLRCEFNRQSRCRRCVCEIMRQRINVRL